MITPEITIDRSLIQTEEEMITRWGEFDKPLVSIHCMTYNHEKYISEALDGFLIQKSDFPFEILVHDDASTDKTADIIRQYEKRYPNIIKPIYQTVNQYSQGKKPGRLNILRAQGKYIAMCEGDDYWHHPKKLQLQVDYLEADSEYGLVHTDGDWLIQKSGKRTKSKFLYDNRKMPQGDIYDELLIHPRIITCTTCINKKYLDEYLNDTDILKQNWLKGDSPLWFFIAYHSKVRYMGFSSATRRVLSESASQSKSISKKYKFFLSGFEVKKYFLRRFPPQKNVRRFIDTGFHKNNLTYGYLLRDRKISHDSYNYLANQDFLSATDRLLYFGSTSKLAHFFVKTILSLKNRFLTLRKRLAALNLFG